MLFLHLLPLESTLTEASIRVPALMFFWIKGVVHHRIGSLLLADGSKPEYAQLYIYDTQNEVQNRLAIFQNDSSHRDQPDPAVVASLIDMLDSCNPLVKQFRLARDRLLSPDSPEISVRLIGTDTAHGSRYSLPVSSELAALIVGDFPTDVSTFDIVVQTHHGDFKQISPLHPALMALQYPLLFPYGDKGFHLGIKLREAGGVAAERGRQCAGPTRSEVLAFEGGGARGKELWCGGGGSGRRWRRGEGRCA